MALEPDDTTESARAASTTPEVPPETRPPPASEVPILDLFHRIEAHARRAAPWPALLGADGRTLRYGELLSRIDRLAGGLRASLRPDGVLLSLLPPGFDATLLELACLAGGVPFARPDPARPAPPLDGLPPELPLSGLAAAPRTHLQRLSHARLREPSLFLSTGFVPLPHVRLDRFGGPPIQGRSLERDRAFLLAPDEEGVTKAHLRGPRVLGEALLAWDTLLGLETRDLCLVDPGLSALPILRAGATCQFLDQDEPRGLPSVERLLGRFEAQRPNVLMLRSSSLDALVEGLGSRELRWPSLRLVVVVGERVREARLARLAEAAPRARLLRVWAPLDLGPLCAADARSLLEFGGDRAGTGSPVGAALPTRPLRLLGPSGHDDAPPGEFGEVAVQGAGDEGETSTWRRVGLLALQDAQGRLYLQGPVGSDVEGFMPLPVEALAESLPFVRRAVLLELEGRSALLVLLTEGLVPADWEELLREATGVWRVQGASRLSLLDPFGPTPPRRALARALISRA